MADSTKCCPKHLTKRWLHLTRVFPLLPSNSLKLSRIVCLIVGCIGMMASSSVWQNSWQNAMRAIFNQTETEVNLVTTFGSIGGTIALPAGILYEHFGTQMNAVVGAVLSGIGFFLLWLAAGQWSAFFRLHKSLLDLAYFVVGFGCTFMYMAVLLPNTENFPSHHRGKVIGLLDASLSAGPTLLTILWNSVFVNGHIKAGEESQQDLAGYFLTVGILTVAANFMIFLFVGPMSKLRKMKRKHDDDDNSPLIDDNRRQVAASEPSSSDYGSTDDFSSIQHQHPAPQVATPLKQAIRQWNFNFLLTQFVLSGSLQITYQANIPTYLRSFNLNEYNLLFTALNTTIHGISKFVAGLVSDMIAPRMPRSIIFIFPYILQTIFLLISVFYGDDFYVLLLTNIAVGLSTGVTWCQSPCILGELYGSKHLGSNWGFFLLVSAAFGFPFSLGFSAVYEAAIEQPGEIYCYGLRCFSWSFAFLAGASFCSLIMAFGLTQNLTAKRMNTRRRSSDDVLS